MSSRKLIVSLVDGGTPTPCRRRIGVRCQRSGRAFGGRARRLAEPVTECGQTAHRDGSPYRLGLWSASRIVFDIFRTHRLQAGGGFSLPIFAIVFLLVLCGPSGNAYAQMLRFNLGHPTVDVPGFATFRMGPFYSHLQFSQSIGVRYTEGTTNVYDSSYSTYGQRGMYRKDGIDVPLISNLSLRNYVGLGRYADLDITFWAQYEYYPLDTQDSILFFNTTAPEFVADIGTGLSSELRPFKNVNVRLHAQPQYLIEYVDQRGRQDSYGGMRYNHLQNTAGIDVDWLMTSDMNLGLSVSRFDVFTAPKDFEDQKQTAYDWMSYYEYEVNPLLVVGARAGFHTVSYKVDSRGDYAGSDYGLFARADLTKSTKASVFAGYGSGSTSATNGVSSDAENGGLVVSASLDTELSKDLKYFLSLGRRLSPGFHDGVEMVDSINTGIRWVGETASASLSAGLDRSDSSGSSYGASYSDWHGALSVSRLLSEDLTLTVSSVYSIRKNERESGLNTAGTPSELVNDYSTWINSAELSKPIYDNLVLRCYVNYMMRDSEAGLMRYDRLNAGIDCRYTCDF